MNDSLLQLLGAVVLAVVVAGHTIYRRFWGPDAKARRRLAEVSTTITDRAVVTLVGSVRAVETLEAPLSGTDCVAYIAWAEVGSSDADRRRNPQNTSKKMVPFELVTSEGTVLIDATDAEIALAPRSLIPRKLDREAKFLTELGRDASRIKLWSFRQISIQENDSIRVQGMALVEQIPPDERDHYRKLGQKVRLVQHEAHPLTIGPA